MDHIGPQRPGGGDCILEEFQVNNLPQDEDIVLSRCTVSVNNGHKSELTYINFEI